MSIQIKTLERVFTKLKVQRTSSNHHVKGFLVDKGVKLYPPVYYSKGRGELPLFVQEKLRKALYLDRKEFSTLCRCKISHEEYYKIRRKRDPS